MYCPKCGAQIEDDAQFCNRCGNIIREMEFKREEKKVIIKDSGDTIEMEVEGEDGRKPEHFLKKNLKIIVGGIAAAVVITAVAIGFNYSFFTGTSLYPHYLGSGFGYINDKGETVFNRNFYIAGEFSEGLAAALETPNGNYGFIDSDGSFKIFPRFFSVGSFSEGLARVQINKGGEWGYIDRKGDVKIQPRFKDAGDFSDGLARVREVPGGMWGFVDIKGAPVISMRYFQAGDFVEGLAPVLENYSGNFGYIDRKGIYKIQQRFFQAKNFSGGLAAVYEQHYGKWGYIDRTGEYKIKPAFSSGGRFINGIASAKDQFNQYGYIDRNGKWLILPQYELTLGFKGGVAKVYSSINQYAKQKLNRIDLISLGIDLDRLGIELDLNMFLADYSGNSYIYINTKGNRITSGTYGKDSVVTPVITMGHLLDYIEMHLEDIYYKVWWADRRVKWINEAKNAGNDLAKLKPLLIEYEDAITFRAKKSDFIGTVRSSWIKDVNKAQTLIDFGNLLVKLEVNIIIKAKKLKWDNLRNVWINEVYKIY